MKKTIFKIGDLLVLKRDLHVQRNSYEIFLKRILPAYKKFTKKSIDANRLLWKADTAPFFASEWYCYSHNDDDDIIVAKGTTVTVVGYKPTFMTSFRNHCDAYEYDIKFSYLKSRYTNSGEVLRIKNCSERLLHIQANGMLIACMVPINKNFELLDTMLLRSNEHVRAVNISLNDDKKLLKDEFDKKVQNLIKYAARRGLKLS